MARSIGIVLAAGFLCIGAAICPAVEISWDKGSIDITTPVDPPYPGDGFWTSGENWRANNTDPQGSPPNDVVPGPGDRANIGLHDQWAQIDAPATIGAADSVTISSIRLGTNPGLGVGGHGKLIIDGGTLNVVDTGTGDHFRIGADSNRTGHLILNAGTVTVADGNRRLILGNGANTNTVGIVDFLGGAITSNGGLFVGGDDPNANRANTQGTFTMGAPGDSLTAQTLNTRTSNLEVGRGGTGTFTQHSGTVTIETNNLILGQGAASDGTYTIDGGKLETVLGQIRVGNTGKGTFVQNGGEVISKGVLDLGNVNNAASDGTYTLAGGTLTVNANMYVGRLRKGTFNFEDGTFNFDKTLYLGGDPSGNATFAPNADGTFNLGTATAAPTLNAKQIEVGRHGLGVFNHTDGDVTLTSANLVISQFADGDGTYNMQAGTLTTVVGDLNFNQGTGAFNQDGGTVNIGRDINFSNGSGTSTYHLTGGTLNVARAIKRRSGTGTLVVDGGTLNVTTGNIAATTFHLSPTTNATYTHSKGTLAVTNLLLGDNAKGTFTQTGGTVNVGSDLVFGPVANRGGTYNLNAGTLNVTGQILERVSAVDSAQLYVDGGTLNVGGNITVQSFRTGHAAGKTGAYTLTGGKDINNTGTFFVGASGTGTLTIDDAGSTVTVANRFQIGEGGNGRGTLNFTAGTIDVNGGGFYVAGADTNANKANTVGDVVMGTAGGNLTDAQLFIRGNFEVGRGGTGTFTQHSGTVTLETNNLVVGQGGTSEGTYTVNGGLLKTLDSSGDAGHLRVGNDGVGHFVQTGGTVDVVTQVELGNNNTAGAEGTYTLQGGTLVIGTGMRIGRNRKGTFNFEDGTLQWNGGSLLIGGNDGSNPTGAPNADGTFNMGTATTAPTMSIGQLEVGRHALGVFNHTSGDVTVTNANLVVSQYANSDGTYNMAGGTVTTVPNAGNTNGDLNFNQGTGAFNQDGGTVNIGRDINFSNGSGTSTYHLTGGTLNVARAIKRRSGTGTLVVDGGTLNVTTGNIAATTFHLSPTTNATYTHSKGTLAVTNLLLGDNAKGTFTQTGGTVNVGSDLVFGPVANRGGTYNLNAGTLNVSGNIQERVAGVDTAQFHLDGGTLNVTGDITTQRFALGQAAGKTGVYALAAGKNLTTTGTLAVGSSGTGDLTIDGGTLVAANSVIGEGAAGDGTVTINNGGSVTVNGLLKVGNNGIGRINLIDGSLTVTAGGLRLAETTNANAEGILTIGDGTTSPVLSVSGGNFETANNGTGTVTMNSGTFHQLTNNIIVGQGPNSNATFTLNDGLIDIQNQLRIANKGTGLFVQNGGTVNVGTALDLANDANNDADATYTMTGGVLNVGDRVANNLVIGNANRAGSTALFEMIDGTLTTSKGIRIANTGANSSGKMTIGDGSTAPTITINGDNFEVADNGTGEVVFNSGTLVMNRNNLLVGQAAGSQATFTMNGGLIDLRPAFAAVADHGRLRTNAGTGIFTLNAGTVYVGNDLDLSDNAAGGLTLNINGGQMIVGLDVNYRNNGTDAINLAGGLLDLTGGNVNFATGTADFNFTGGRLQDVGTFGSTLVQNGGTLAPGQLAGTMAMTGGYAQNAGVLEIEIGGLDQGNEYDFLDVSGTADLDASLQVRLTGGFDPQLGDSFDVVTAAGINILTGFTLDQSLLDPSQQYFAYRVIPGGNGQILRLQLVPEPSTIVTAALGLVALIALAWRRRRIAR